MTEDIVQNMISQLGQSQDERAPKELGIHFADFDERTPADLLLFTKRLSKFVNYYVNNITGATGDWQTFFSFDESDVEKLVEESGGNSTPHIALLTAFFRLLETPREVGNRITGKHLDFFYRQVLGFVRKAAVPDRAHVIVGLKKNALPTRIGPENMFSAGKDNTGIELIYAPTRETVIGAGKVESLRSIFVDKGSPGTVRFAPIANSADGTGAAVPENEPKWFAFGHPGLPSAKIGFAIASPLLRMQEGDRKVQVSLTLGNVDSGLGNTSLQGALEVFVTGEKTWLGPYGTDPHIQAGNVLTLEFIIPASEKAVIDYDSAIHGHSYNVQAPVIQVLLSSGAAVGYNELKGLTLLKAQLSVDVRHVTSLVLESDGGSLDPKKAFMPFGAQPTAGSRFVVGSSEALSKKLSELTLTVQWKGAPASFSQHYANYGAGVINDAYFTASASFADAGSWVEKKTGVKLFDPRTSDSVVMLTFAPGGTSTSAAVSEGARVYALSTSGSGWALTAALRQIRLNPVLTSFLTVPPEPRENFVTFALERNFLHETYRVKYVENVLKYSKGQTTTLVVLNEPYTPTVQFISLSYKAHTDNVGIGSGNLDDFANPDVQFFHIGCFGQMREHRYQRQQLDFVINKSVTLLPAYENAGEFLIGLSNLRARDSVSILFQAAEGSADPELDSEVIQWFALCDNYWKRLNTSEVAMDTTNRLLRSGIVQFVLPPEATTMNSILPAGYVWLKAAVPDNVQSVCELIDVTANAIEVEFIDRGNDPNHLSAALEAKKITKLAAGLASVQKVTQPFASFGGKPAELEASMSIRASERLRHKDRCITPWDYERIVLDRFPGVHKVKCINHARDGMWQTPGHVMVVVIPDLRNKNAVDPLQPRVDANTLSQITSTLLDRTGMQVELQVRNPRYQKIQLDFKVKFRTGYEFNFYSGLLRQELIRLLSPWAYASEREISFGGQVYKSVLLDAVEDLDYVDYVTDFKMYSYAGDLNRQADINEARAETPDAILVSDYTHLIAEAV